MTDESLSWEVALPEHAAASLGQRRPCAHLLVTSEGHGSEELRIPVAVGKRLKASRAAGEALPTTRAELLWLVGELSRSCGRARIETLVNRRDYSCSELSEKLRQDGYGVQVTEELVARAREAGAVDDARFAETFVRSKVLAGWGHAKIERELARRGIELSEVQGWPDEFLSADDERARALELASRRRLTGKNDFQKVTRFLCGRGFAMSLAMDVAREVTRSE